MQKLLQGFPDGERAAAVSGINRFLVLDRFHRRFLQLPF